MSRQGWAAALPDSWALDQLMGLVFMLRVRGDEYIALGTKIQGARVILIIKDGEKYSADADEAKLRDYMRDMLGLCAGLGLPISKELFEELADKLPKTVGEFDIAVKALMAELKSKLFLFVPPHRAFFYEDPALVSPTCRLAFPSAATELRWAGNCYAAGAYTACVFHSMRAAEIGVRILAKRVGVKFPFPLELADWVPILKQIDSKIKAMQDLSKSKKKDADLNFFSDAAAQFRYFKDAYRVRSAHVREDFEEQKAVAILEHTRDFFESLSRRLREPNARRALSPASSGDLPAGVPPILSAEQSS